MTVARSTVRTKSAVAVALALLFTVLFAGPALAHATLLNATPAAGSVIPQAPADINLSYDEAVGTQAGAVKVLAPDGTRVDTGTVTSSDGGRTVTAPLQPNLAEGTYTILWRVLSEDSHSIFGASTFSVGHASSTVAGAVADAEASGGKAAQNALGIGRFLLYTGLILLMGGLAFLLVLWPVGRSVRAARRVLWIGLGLTGLATLGDLFLQGPYTAGAGLGSLFDPTLIANTLGTRFGVATVVRLVLLGAMALLLTQLEKLRRPVLGIAAAAVGFAVFLSVSLLGHSGAGDLLALALVADSLHLAAMSAWIGGLVFLGAVLLRKYPNEAARLLPRWSRFAMSCVGVLVVTGTFTAWRQVRQLDALVSTTYGITLLIKLGLVAVILGFAAFGRFWVQRHFGRKATVVANVSAPAALVYADGSTAVDADRDASSLTGSDDDADASPGSGSTGGHGGRGADVRSISAGIAAKKLRRTVLIEAAVAVIVLGVTSVLVATTPARDTYFPVFEQTIAATADLQVDITVDPARSGMNNLEFVFTANGNPVDVVQASTRWTSQDGDYVVPAELTRVGVGTYTATGLLLPSAGTWKLAITTQTSDIDSNTVVLSVPIS